MKSLGQWGLMWHDMNTGHAMTCTTKLMVLQQQHGGNTMWIFNAELSTC